MNGKNKCKLLKQIRQKIADENDIQYVTTECKFQGQCTGTCPKCEAELRYLEQELDKRRKAGKAIAVAGIAAAMVVTATGCDLFGTPLQGKDTIPPEQQTTADAGASTEAVKGELIEETQSDKLFGRVAPSEVIWGELMEETLPESPLPGLVPPSKGIWGELLKGDVPYEEADPTGEADYKQTTEDLILTGDVAWPVP